MEKYRILIVDDEDDVRTIERLALNQKYEVVEAHDGLDALEWLERAEPDFVILDVMMPLMDGFECCRAIRKSPTFRDAPVLFVSAKRDKGAIQEGYSSGANLYLTKPFEPERLVKNVDFFFQENTKPPRPKTHTLEQLHEMAKPRREPTPVPVVTAQAVEAPKPRVIIVDDQEDLVGMLSLALEREFEVLSARDGVEAIEKIIHYEPDLIVLDALLPKMSGYQLCQMVRKNKTYYLTPIVFISGKASARDQDYCRKLGANDFLAKPFDPEVLRRRLLGFARAEGFLVKPKKFAWWQIVAVQRTANVDWNEKALEQYERARRVRDEPPGGGRSGKAE